LMQFPFQDCMSQTKKSPRLLDRMEYQSNNFTF